jgi:hypothetical protein
VIRRIFLRWVLAPTILLIFFCDLFAPQVIISPDPVHLDGAGFYFRPVDGDECLAAFMAITSNSIGSDGISLKFLKLLLPFIIEHVLHVFNHAITCSLFPTM